MTAPPESASPPDRTIPGAFGRLLAASAFSLLGFRIMALAMPLVAVVALEASAFMVSVVAAAQTVAFLLFGLPAGALVDRLRRRHVLVFCDFGRAVALAFVPIAWWSGVLSISHLIVVAFTIGVLTMLFDVADQTYLPEIVSSDRLIRSNSRLVMVDQVTGIAGPGVGGLLIQAISAPFTLIVTCLGYLWSGTLLAGIKDGSRPRPRAGRRAFGKEIAEGVRAVMADPLLRPIVFCSTTQTLFWSVAFLMLLVLLADELAVNAATIGLLLTLGSLGGVLASLLVNRLIAVLGDGRAMRLGVAIGGLCTILAALTQPDWRLLLVSVASFGLGFGLVVYNVAQVSFRQRRVPSHLLGRVNATVRFFAWGARPIGSLLGGTLAALLSVRHAVFIGAIGTSLAALWLYLSPLRHMDVLPVNRVNIEPQAKEAGSK